MRHVTTILLVVCLGVAACGERATPGTGDEGGHCYPNGTCNGALVCLSTYCVREGSCYPGVVEDCTCTGNRAGTRTCDQDGAWGSCQCTDPCGNGTCDVWEDAASCPADCGTLCGNGVCESGETIGTCPQDCAVLQTNKVDLLFMIDNSNTMEPKQASLNQVFPNFIQPLKDLPSKPDLHIGIVTSDLGSGQFTVPSCDTIGGDQGILQNTANGTTCTTAHLNNAADRFLSYAVDSSGNATQNFTGDIAEAFACYASVGVGGCGFEHQLASVRAAIDGCESDTGCKQRQNVGFFRQDAYLAVIILTDEDDCSAPSNSTLFDPTQTTLNSALGPLTSYRCFEFGNLCGGTDPGRTQGPRQDCVPGNKDSNTAHQLTPTADFAAFLKGLKPQSPRMVYVATITGPTVPVSVGLDANGYPDLQPACTGGMGSADPGIRLAEFVSRFDVDRARFHSICDADLSQAMGDIAQDLAQMLP